ncbi:MAG: HPF/RaiA family ribosome-associated protein [Planctomycetota bacterium]|jgi:ribosomal subunit interface protein
MQIQVTFRDMRVSDAVEARCWKEAEGLERYFDRIVSCHVTIAESHRRRRQGNLFDVRINLSVPGRELVVNRQAAEHQVDEDIDIALREAFDRMRRQLQDHVRKIRGQVKKHERPEEIETISELD